MEGLQMEKKIKFLGLILMMICSLILIASCSLSSVREVTSDNGPAKLSDTVSAVATSWTGYFIVFVSYYNNGYPYYTYQTTVTLTQQGNRIYLPCVGNGTVLSNGLIVLDPSSFNSFYCGLNYAGFDAEFSTNQGVQHRVVYGRI